MGNWVDFREIKQKITMEMVLSHYGLLDKFKRTAKGLRGSCPIHGGSHANQFHVDTSKNTWNCFGGCDMDTLEGHVIGFVAAMEKMELRDAALLLAQWFDLEMIHPSQKADKPHTAKKELMKQKPGKATSDPPVPESPVEEDPENQELTFQLKTLSSDHPYFRERQVSQEATQHFGIGFCSRGMFKNRVVFPLHRPTDGRLIGYTGRSVEPVTDDNPKWLLPSLIKPKLLFNYHRIKNESTVIVVEGCFSAVAVFQAGFPNVVALLGKDVLADDRLSYDQLRLLSGFKQVVLLLDGDPDGQAGAERTAAALASKTWLRIVRLPDDQDPSDFRAQDIQSFLSFLL